MLTLRGYAVATRLVGIVLALFSPVWLSGAIAFALLGLVHGDNVPTQFNGVHIPGIRNNIARFVVEIVAMIVATMGFARFPYYSEDAAQTLCIGVVFLFAASLLEPILRK